MTHRNLSDLRSKNAEMEEQMIQLNKELHANQEIAKALEIDLKENVAQKSDQVQYCPTIHFMDGTLKTYSFLQKFSLKKPATLMVQFKT